MGARPGRRPRSTMSGDCSAIPPWPAVAAERGVPMVIMHNRDAADATIDIFADLDGLLHPFARHRGRAGVNREDHPRSRHRLRQDAATELSPCIGALTDLTCSGLPLLLGASRKRFIDFVSPSPPDRRLGGSIASHLFAAAHGAAILRVHDVGETVQALKVAAAIEGTTMSDTIFVNGLTVRAFHGVMPHEAKVGQSFIHRPGARYRPQTERPASDKLADTVAYDQVAMTASDAFYRANASASSRPPPAPWSKRSSRPFPKITAFRVTVRKPHAPVAGHFRRRGRDSSRSPPVRA